MHTPHDSYTVKAQRDRQGTTWLPTRSGEASHMHVVVGPLKLPSRWNRGVPREHPALTMGEGKKEHQQAVSSPLGTRLPQGIVWVTTAHPRELLNAGHAERAERPRTSRPVPGYVLVSLMGAA